MTAAPLTAQGVGYARRWPALFVILTAEVMDLLDALVTSIAGPTIVRELGGGSTLIQWLSAAYTIAMASGLLIGGRLGDRLGRPTVFRAGMVGFTLASLVCALAPNPELLLAFRAVQGLFGALMLPQGLGMLKEMFPPAEAARAFGAFGPVMGLSAVGGPILAGWLVDLDLLGWSWRTIFAINLPLGALALAAGARVLPPARRDRAARVDAMSALIASTAMVALVYPLIQGRELGWPAWCYLLIALGIALFAGLARLERARERAGRATLVVPSLFGRRAFAAGVATGMAFFGALTGLSLVFTLFVQLGLGYDPLHAGLAGIAQALGMVVGFGVAQPLVAGPGGRATMLVGEGVGIAGLVGLATTLARYGDGVDGWVMSPALLVVGLGMGLIMAPFFDIVLAGVDDRESGSASGVLTSVQQLAGAVGVAILGTLFFHLLDGTQAASRVGAFRAAAWPTVLATGGFMLAAALLTTLLPARAEHPAAH